MFLIRKILTSFNFYIKRIMSHIIFYQTGTLVRFDSDNLPWKMVFCATDQSNFQDIYVLLFKKRQSGDSSISLPFNLYCDISHTLTHVYRYTHKFNVSKFSDHQSKMSKVSAAASRAIRSSIFTVISVILASPQRYNRSVGAHALAWSNLSKNALSRVTARRCKKTMERVRWGPGRRRVRRWRWGTRDAEGAGN